MLVNSKLLLPHKKATASSYNCSAVMLHLHLLQRVLGYHFYITPKQLFSIQKYWKISANKHIYSILRERPIWAYKCNDERIGVTKLYQCNICGLNHFILGSDIFMGFIDNKKRLFFFESSCELDFCLIKTINGEADKNTVVLLLFLKCNH